MSIISTFLYVILAIFIFGFLIVIHESGHFITARIFGVTVNEFSIGMGPKLFSKTSKKSGTVYSLRLLPFGGYVAMAGENDESDDENAFSKKSVWKRFIITVAGSVMNITVGVILVTVMVCNSKLLGSCVVHGFADESASEKAGLCEMDVITKVDGVSVHTCTELVYEIMRNGIKPIDLTVKRNGETVVIENIEFPTNNQDGVVFGSPDFYLYAEEKTIPNIIKQSFWQSVSSSKMIYDSLFDLISGRYSIEQVSGPIGTTKEIVSAADEGSSNLLYICSIIALNLGLFNLLPLPALDGGRAFFQVIEMVRRKPINPKYEGYVHTAGFILLLLFMAVITYKDIVKIFMK